MATSYSPAKMSSKENLAETAETGPDSVLMHQFNRNQMGPSLSPFALKLETYLRMAKITYANDFNKPASPSTGKCPWVTYKGQEISDSTMIMDFLKATKVGLDPNSELSATDRAVARAFQKMIEEELFWCFTLWRWIFDKTESTVKAMQAGKIKSFLVGTYVRREVKKGAHGQGIGRHSPAEVQQIGENDIRAVGDFLGGKKYFMGETVSDIDCTVFGFFAQLVYCSPTCPLTTFMREHYTNIIDYCDRIKAEFWPDWDEICQSALPKPVEKEKKSLKSTTSTGATDPTGNGTVTNGNHVAVTGDPAATTTIEHPTVVVVQETTQQVITTPNNDVIVVKQVEFTKSVTIAEKGKENGTGGENGVSTNGFHEETNGGFHDEDTVVSQQETAVKSDSQSAEVLSAV